MPNRNTLPAAGYHTIFDFILHETRAVSYTLDADSVTADSEGDKMVKSGTVLIAGAGTGGLAYPAQLGHTALTAVAILKEEMNLRDGNEAGAGLIDGWVDTRFVTDTTFGTVTAQHVTDLSHIKFDTRNPLID